jgi:threonyl-tRNA synthetase
MSPDDLHCPDLVCDLHSADLHSDVPQWDDPHSHDLNSADLHWDDVVRHSAEHVLADAVRRLWPDAKIDAGRSDHGEKYQYDFDLAHRISPGDLPRIEDEMRRIIAEDAPFVREEVSREEAERIFRGDPLKLARLADVPEGEVISIYRHGAFVDLCRGPHVARAGQIGAIKLLDVSGVHLRGDESRPMLQRVYGTAFASQAGLDAWMARRAEAERRDHRKLGRELDLFSIEDDVGAGLVLWHPKGALVKKLMEDWWRTEHLARGYGFVSSPHVGKADLWRTSGHLDFYREGMFSAIEMEGADYHLKPMNCPFHMMVYRSKRRSHRELPMRLAELGTVYRYERSGVLHGLMRVRGFTQDDAHVFCAPDQVEDEIVAAVSFALDLLRAFGFEKYRVTLSTRPAEYVGEPSEWVDAIAALERAAQRLGLDYGVDEGGGAFYGPKIDVQIEDAIGRLWQCSTVQFDFNLPARFDLSYIGSDNQPHRPVVVHRALFGSLERFFGVLIEHYAGALPAWLAPEQVRVVAITDRVLDYADEVAAAARRGGARAEVDRSNQKLGAKLKGADGEKVPIVLVVGDAEVAKREVAARVRGEKVGNVVLGELAAWLAPRIAPPGAAARRA